MYPAAEVEAAINHLELRIARLEEELADARHRLAAIEPAQSPEVRPEPAGHQEERPAGPVGERPPEPLGDLLADFLGVLHQPRPSAPSCPDGHQGNFR